MLSSGSADTRGAVGVEGWASLGVDIGWGPSHGVLVSRVVTRNSTNTYYLAIGTPRVSEFSKRQQKEVTKKTD